MSQLIEVPARKVERHHYVDYFSRAEQCLHAAQRAEEQGEWDACAINSVQSVISASDALSTHKLGVRGAGQKHEDAARLFKSIDFADAAVQENANRLSRILAAKNESAYEENPVGRKEAEHLLLEAKRLFDFVKSRLPQ